MTKGTGINSLASIISAALVTASATASPAAPAAAGAMPPDIDKESGFRLPLPRRETMDAEGQATFDTIMAAQAGANRGPAGPGVGLKGPHGIQMYSPRTAAISHQLATYLRFESGIPGRTRELAILVTAREMDHQFVWTGHEPMALREGLEPSIIDIVRHRKSVSGLADKDAVIVQLGREAIGDKKVSSATFARAKALYGPQMLVDIVALIGLYASGSIFLTVFDMQLPADWKPLLPPR